MGSLNRTFAILCNKIQHHLPPLALGTHYNCIQYTSPLLCPKPGRTVQWTMGIKSQPPYELKASSGRGGRKQNNFLGWLPRTQPEAPLVPVPWSCHFPACHVKPQNTRRIKINLTTLKQKALTSFKWLYKERNHTQSWIKLMDRSHTTSHKHAHVCAATHTRVLAVSVKRALPTLVWGASTPGGKKGGSVPVWRCVDGLSLCP